MRAFSLIELLVVLVIIGTLAAIAVPSYRRYTVAARLDSHAQALTELMEQAIAAQARQPNYGFPQSYCFNGYPQCNAPLGITANTGAGAIDDAAAARLFPALLPSTSAGGLWLTDLGTCGQGILGMAVVSLDPAKVGFDANVATTAYTKAGPEGGLAGVVLACYYWVSGGVTHKFCDYAYGTASGSGTDPILPGWPNANSNTANDNANENTNVWNNPTLTSVNSC